VRLAALILEEDLRVDLGGLGPESVIQRISGFHLIHGFSHFHLNVAFLCKLLRIHVLRCA